jgi:hypothetical protein
MEAVAGFAVAIKRCSMADLRTTCAWLAAGSALRREEPDIALTAAVSLVARRLAGMQPACCGECRGDDASPDYKP